jgi:hypothetical protein
MEKSPTVTTEEAAETVEASKQVNAVEASRPMYFTKPRSPITTGGSYLEHTIRAKLGNEDSRQWVAAADDSASPLIQHCLQSLSFAKWQQIPLAFAQRLTHVVAHVRFHQQE